MAGSCDVLFKRYEVIQPLLLHPLRTLSFAKVGFLIFVINVATSLCEMRFGSALFDASQ